MSAFSLMGVRLSSACYILKALIPIFTYSSKVVQHFFPLVSVHFFFRFKVYVNYNDEMYGLPLSILLKSAGSRWMPHID